MSLEPAIALLRGLLLVYLLLDATITHAQSNEELKKGVVKITAIEGQKKKVGTGFIVKADSDAVYIVTAAHVIAGDSQPKVQFFTQQEVQIQTTVKHVEGSDDPTALALLVLRGKGNIPAGLMAMSLATATRVTSGDDIMVIGNPRGAGDWAIIKGSIASREGRDLKVDANIDEGNSGGPIMHNGQVVGLIGGAQRYGKGVTIGTVREYLEGHGVVAEERASPSVAKAPPPSSPPTQPTAKPESQPVTQAREIIGKDGAPMVLIPAGSFLMGSTKDEVDRAIRGCKKEDQLLLCRINYEGELPQHKVQMDAFYLDKYEVTNQLFQRFVQQTRYRTEAELRGFSRSPVAKSDNLEDVNGAHWRKPEGNETVFESKRGEHPVVTVSWDEAHAYCRWAEKRLPTEAEFEYATRAGSETNYWWGNNNPYDRLVANVADESAKREFLGWTITVGYDDGYVRTAPVGSFEANQFGLHDMIGNVWEWTGDWYSKDYYYKEKTQRNPKGPSNGESRTVRGGSWFNLPGFFRSAVRYGVSPTENASILGLRCAQDAK